MNDNSTLRQLEEDYNFTENIKEEAKKLPTKIGDAAGVLSDIGIGPVSRLFAVVNILILSAFMLGGGAGWVQAFARRHPPDRADAIRRLANRTRDAVSAYVAGALAQATVAGVTSFIVLTILGVPFATALAALIFVLDLIPLVGATIGAVLVGDPAAHPVARGGRPSVRGALVGAVQRDPARGARRAAGDPDAGRRDRGAAGGRAWPGRPAAS